MKTYQRFTITFIIIAVIFIGIEIFKFVSRWQELVVVDRFDTSSNVEYNCETTSSIGQGKHLVCRIPPLCPHSDEVNKFSGHQKPITCPGSKDWVALARGILKFQIPGDFRKGINCTVSYIRRDGDFDLEHSIPEVLNVDGEHFLKEDHFKVRCATGGNVVYERIHTTIVKKKSSIPKFLDGGTRFDILLFGLDSVSRMSFIRNLPLSYRYFTEVMNGHVMAGYNVVGDGTFRNVLPMLTGYKEEELPSTRKSDVQHSPADVYPLIWKLYKKRGYVTNYAEDCAYIGTFVRGRAGFRKQPTDHYMRPFHLAIESQERSGDGNYSTFCVGTRGKADIFFNNVKEFWSQYRDRPKFMLAFYSGQSHSDNTNLVQTLDPTLLELLQTMRHDPVFTDTVLVLFSDHGSRFSEMRKTVQGRLEERLPFLGILLPDKLKSRHANIFPSLQTNAERLSTPLDVHATLLHTLSLVNKELFVSSNRRSQSLFHTISSKRTCDSAGIADNWCTCSSWNGLDTHSEIVADATRQIVAHVNKILPSNCHPLSLLNISKAYELSPGLIGQGAHNSLASADSRDTPEAPPSLSKGMPIFRHITYQIWFSTLPNSALFEATIVYDIVSQNFVIQADDISRLDKYGDSANCLQSDRKHLSQFCSCKVNIT